MGGADVGEAVEYFGHGVFLSKNLVVFTKLARRIARLIFFANGVADADVADDYGEDAE